MNSHIDLHQLSEIVEARANFYNFLSSFYLEPPARASLDSLRAEAAEPALEEAFGAGTIGKIRQSLKDLDGECERIIQEFHNLFLVPGPQYVTPHESCFREKRMKKGRLEKGLLMGRSTREVKRFYRENGFEVSKNFKDLPDHLVLELNLMFTLCQKEKEAWDSENPSEAIETLKQEKRFLTEHLIHWIPALCEEIREKTAVPLYQGIAQMTQEFIEREQDTFDSLPL